MDRSILELSTEKKSWHRTGDNTAYAISGTATNTGKGTIVEITGPLNKWLFPSPLRLGFETGEGKKKKQGVVYGNIRSGKDSEIEDP